MKSMHWGRAIGVAIVAYAVVFAAFLLLFGNPFSRQLIYSSVYGQSPKLLAVWMQIEPLPAVTPFWEDLFEFNLRKVGVLALFFPWFLAHVWIFAQVAHGLPGRGWRKGLGFGLGLWLTAYLFFELFTPLNQFGEPLPLVAYELGLDLLIGLAEGVVIAALYPVSR